MALMTTFVKYSCFGCDEFLFSSADVQNKTKWLMFVDEKIVRKKIVIAGTNTIQCKTCDKPLGGMIYLSFYPEKNHIARFCLHLLNCQKDEVFLYKRKKEEENDDDDDPYYIQYICGKKYHIRMGK